MLQIPGLYISVSPKRGRGVFVAVDIEVGSIIEICPYIFIPAKDVGVIHQTVLHDYYFLLPDSDGAVCLPLGYGCLYNHSSTPNAEVHIDIAAKHLEIHCIEDIKGGDEILINYNGQDKQIDLLWFKAS